MLHRPYCRVMMLSVFLLLSSFVIAQQPPQHGDQVGRAHPQEWRYAADGNLHAFRRSGRSQF